MASRVSKLKNILQRVMRRTHPDVYEAVKEYASEKNIRIGDVIAAATSAYLSADDDGKDVLEKALSERTGGGGGGANIGAAVKIFEDVCKAMGTMFSTMNEAKSSLSAASIVADYKAIATAAEEIKKVGGEGGSGSLGDSLADAFVRNLIERGLGGKLTKSKKTKKTGTTNVEKLD